MLGKQHRRRTRTFCRSDNRTYISYIFHTIKKNKYGILSSTRRKHLFQISICIRLQRRGHSLMPDTFRQTVKLSFLRLNNGDAETFRFVSQCQEAAILFPRFYENFFYLPCTQRFQYAVPAADKTGFLFLSPAPRRKSPFPTHGLVSAPSFLIRIAFPFLFIKGNPSVIHRETPLPNKKARVP